MKADRDPVQKHQPCGRVADLRTNMANPNRFVPYTNFNAGGFVHATATGWEHQWKDPISTGCTAPPAGASVSGQRWPKTQLHPATPTVTVSAAARSGARPCVARAAAPRTASLSRQPAGPPGVALFLNHCVCPQGSRRARGSDERAGI